MENLSLFIHSYVISNLNDFLSSVEYTHTNVFCRIFLTNFVRLSLYGQKINTETFFNVVLCFAEEIQLYRFPVT